MKARPEDLRLSPKEVLRLRFGTPLILQATPDNSPGADVVKSSFQDVVLVDGTGSGAQGNRGAAEAQADILHLSSELCFEKAAYIAVRINDSDIRVRARGGTVGIVWEEKEGAVMPRIFWAGRDTLGAKSQVAHHDIANARALMLLSDGGLSLLASRRLLGNLPGQVKDAKGLALFLQTPFADDELFNGGITKLLEPLTMYYREHDTSGVYTFLQRRFISLKRAGIRQNEFTDDATLVFTPITK